MKYKKIISALLLAVIGGIIAFVSLTWNAELERFESGHILTNVDVNNIIFAVNRNTYDLKKIDPSYSNPNVIDMLPGQYFNWTAINKLVTAINSNSDKLKSLNPWYDHSTILSKWSWTKLTSAYMNQIVDTVNYNTQTISLWW